MSWDVVLMNYEGTTEELYSEAKDFKPPPLGDAQDLRDLISKTEPDVDWSDPSHGRLSREEFSVEFSILTEESVDSVMLHVRGGGQPLPAIVKICKAGGWCAYDCSSSDIIDLDNPSDETWIQFQKFRDSAIASMEKKPWWRFW